MMERYLCAEHAEMAERLNEAWWVLKRPPDKDLAILIPGGQRRPMMPHTAVELAAYEGIKLRRPPPSHQQVDRMHEVLDWLLALAQHERDYSKAGWLMCALGLKVGRAAKELGCHRNSARAWRDNGLERLCQIKTKRDISRPRPRSLTV